MKISTTISLLLISGFSVFGQGKLASIHKFTVPLADEDVKFSLANVTYEENRLTLAILKQEDFPNRAIWYPYVEKYTLGENLELIAKDYFDFLKNEEEDVLMFSKIEAPATEMVTEQLGIKVLSSLMGKEKTTASSSSRDLIYDYYTNEYYRYKPNYSGKELVYDKLPEKNTPITVDFPKVAPGPDLKKQYFWLMDNNYFWDVSKNTTTTVGGVILKGKGTNKRNHYQNQYILTIDAQGNKKNEVVLNFEYPRSVLFSKGLDKKEVMPGKFSYGGYVYVFGSVFGLGKKNNDPDKSNYWVVRLDENGKEIFRKKLKISAAPNIVSPLDILVKDDKLILVNENGTKNIDVISISNTGEDNVNTTTLNDIEFIGVEAKTFNFHDKIVTQSIVTEKGNVLISGYYKKIVQRQSINQETREVIPEIINYPGVFTYQVNSENVVNSVYNLEINNAPNAVLEPKLLKGTNEKLFWYIAAPKSKNEISDQTNLEPFGIRTPIELKQYNYYSNGSVVGVIDADNLSMKFNQYTSEDYQALNKKPYIVIPDKNVAFLFGTKESQGKRMLIVHKFEL